MVALIELTKDRELEQDGESQRREKGKHGREQETSGYGIERDGQVRTQHVKDAVREIDEIHHAEHQRKSGRDQEQEDAELQAVEDLHNEESGAHASLHRTFLGVGVGIVLEHLFHDLRLILAVRALDHLDQIEVLNRIMIDIESEIAAQRLEIRLHQSGTQCVLVAEISVQLP